MADEVPANLDITLVRGDTWEVIFQVREDDGVTPIDLTGYTVKIQVRRVPLDPEAPSLDLAIGTGITVATPANGEIAVFAQTSGLVACEYVWDLQLTAPGGRIETLMGGKFTLVQDVTT